jgi:hypothetical protein
MIEKIIYTIGSNHCNCSPEDCCCNEYKIYKNGEKFLSVYCESTAIEIAEALNFREKYKHKFELDKLAKETDESHMDLSELDKITKETSKSLLELL